MRRAPRTALWPVALAFAALAAGEVRAQSSAPAPTIADLSKKKVEVHKDTPADANATKAMENYRHFLELQNTDPKLRAEAMRRLGDLNLDSGEMQRLEQEVTAVDLQGAEAIKLYTTLLKAYPDYPRNDQVLYQLARAYETTGQPEPALATLDRIVQKYPQSSHMDEVQFRRGELLFSAKRYPEAEKAYAAVIGRGGTSAFYQQSLYKHGWSLFKQSLTLESLPSFGGVLDRELGTAPGKAVKLESLKRGDRELVDDTLRVMSITFSYNDGAASLEQYMKEHGERPYAWLLYQRLGDFYVDNQRFQDAAGVYRAYVARDPYSDHAPDLDMAAIEAYGKGGFAFDTMSHRGSLLCMPDGIWAWPVTAPAEIDQYSLQRVFKAANAIDTLIVGTGTEVWLPPRGLREALRAVRVVLDPMLTGPAIRTYNIMLGERRRVAAALIAVP